MTLFLIALLSNISCDQLASPSGDIVSFERNWIFFPKCRLEFPHIPVKGNSERIYRFREIPSRAYSFKFELRSQDGRRSFKSTEINNIIWEQLQKADIQLKIVFLADSEKKLSFGPGPFLKNWKFAAWGDVWYFWNKELSNLSVGRKNEYQFNISFEAINFTKTNLVLVPVIEGGGIVIDL